jgi:hypothetical protein
MGFTADYHPSGGGGGGGGGVSGGGGGVGGSGGRNTRSQTPVRPKRGTEPVHYQSYLRLDKILPAQVWLSVCVCFCVF